MSKRRLTLTVNGRDHEVWTPASTSLLDVLHDDLGMADVRYGCGEGVCGTCTVLLDGEPVNACLLLAVQVEGHQVTTLRGLMGPGDELHPLQECFLRRGGSQCGFCTPGMVLTSLDLVRRRGRPTREEIRYALIGNLCRCTGYTKILDAVEEYAAGAGKGGAGGGKGGAGGGKGGAGAGKSAAGAGGGAAGACGGAAGAGNGEVGAR